MAKHQPLQVMGYHSCDMEVGLRILNGQDQLKISNNEWDWLGDGIYFWEENPYRALEYAREVASGSQKSKGSIKMPFVIGAIIELGNCLNLVESASLETLKVAFEKLELTNAGAKKEMPINAGNNRKLDCAVIKYVHESNRREKQPKYDSVRSSFLEGGVIYPTANFAARNHIQICVRDAQLIKGYFLPLPVQEFNPAI